MAQNTESLEGAVLAAFEQACQENDYEIAEHLLRALEAISQREGNACNLDKHYLKLADPLTKRQ